MKKRTEVIQTLIVSATAILMGILAYCLWATNDLGLTAMDLAVGAPVDVPALRTKTKAVANTCLAQHQADLEEACGGPYELTVDYFFVAQNPLTRISVIVLLLLLGYFPAVFSHD